MSDHFQNVVIIGIGLIGGSLAKALLEKQSFLHIVGVDQSEQALAQALQLGVVHRSISLFDSQQLESCIREADVIVLALPVADIVAVVQMIEPFLSARVVLTDVGSTKHTLMVELQAVLQDKMRQFVPAHPIAGSEKSGVQAASARLFEACKVVICPHQTLHRQALQQVEKMWRDVDAQVYLMPAKQHDEVFSAVSHLPHVLAFAFFEAFLRLPQTEFKLDFAGSGFRDFTRIAAADEKVWSDICLENQAMLLRDIQVFQGVLAELAQAIHSGDQEQLQAVFMRAKQARKAWQSPVLNES